LMREHAYIGLRYAALFGLQMPRGLTSPEPVAPATKRRARRTKLDLPARS